MTIKKKQIEERLAVAIYRYVRVCGEARRATTEAEKEAARLNKNDRRKILGGIETTFHKIGGDEAAMRRRLHEIMIPTVPLDHESNVTPDASCDTEYEEVTV